MRRTSSPTTNQIRLPFPRRRANLVYNVAPDTSTEHARTCAVRFHKVAGKNMPTVTQHSADTTKQLCAFTGSGCGYARLIRDVVFCAAQSAALAPSKETPNLVPSSQSRPADILIPNWSRGRPAALDVHVISPLQRQTLGQAASTPGHALEVGTRRKLASHLSACRSVGVEFIPLVTETLGGLSGDTINTIRSLGLAIEQRTGSPNSTKHLFKSLAVALWQGNATRWLHRDPTLPPSLDGLT